MLAVFVGARRVFRESNVRGGILCSPFLEDAMRGGIYVEGRRNLAGRPTLLPSAPSFKLSPLPKFYSKNNDENKTIRVFNYMRILSL